MPSLDNADLLRSRPPANLAILIEYDIGVMPRRICCHQNDVTRDVEKEASVPLL